MTDRCVMDRAFKSPVRKLVLFFEKSRNKWKAKCVALRVELRREQNQRRAVEKSRRIWRRRAETADQRVFELESQLAELKKPC